MSDESSVPNPAEIQTDEEFAVDMAELEGLALVVPQVLEVLKRLPTDGPQFRLRAAWVTAVVEDAVNTDTVWTQLWREGKQAAYGPPDGPAGTVLSW